MLRIKFRKPKTLKQSIALYVRVTEEGGRRRYLRFNPLKSIPGIYCLRYEQEGKRTWETVGTDLAAAMEAKYKAEAKRYSQDPTIGLKASAPRPKTLARLRVDFLETKRLTKKSDGSRLDKETLSAYQQQVTEFLRAAGKTYANEIDAMDLRRYMNALEERGLTHRTICNNYTSIATFLKYCGVDHKSLLPIQERPRPHDDEPEAYTHEEVARFLFSAPRERDRLFFEFLLKTGAREKEATFLEWKDLSLGPQPTVKIQNKPHMGFRTKTGRSRVVPLERGLATKLLDWQQKHLNSRLVFGTRSDKPDTHFLETCKQIALKAGLNCGRCASRDESGKPRHDKHDKLICCKTHPVCDRWYLHKWRDTFGTWALRRGVDIRTVQAWMGHSSITMTQRYLAPGEGKYAQDGINSAFNVNLDFTAPLIERAAM